MLGYPFNPLDHILRKAARKKQKRFLLIWNRGLGDIPLGLYGVVHRIRSFIPEAAITVFTRMDLVSGFEMLKEVEAIGIPSWKRGTPLDISQAIESVGRPFDVVLEKVDPTRWTKWQLGKLVPRLHWKEEWDKLAERFPQVPSSAIGIHLDTETGQYYGYEKNWPKEQWKELFHKVHEPFVLFGGQASPEKWPEYVIDLRGKTTLFEMLSLIKNRCSRLVVPDSGVLSIAYYVDAAYPLRVVSLWSDPRQGILRQRVASPNPHLEHIPLIGENRDVKAIKVDAVVALLEKEKS